MLLSLFKVKGHSMEPRMKDGSFFIASSIPFIFSKPKVGDNVLFDNEQKRIVKKIVRVENDKYFIEGENLKDSKSFDPIKRRDILAKILWTY